MGAVTEPVENASVDAEGYIGRIPVRNLWLLMLYASELFRTRGIGTIGLEDSPDELPDLVAEILAHAVEVRQRRRLSLGYRSRDAVINRVRGRIDVLNTERHRLLDRGLVACRFDELTIDTPRNRYVRAALDAISRIVRRKEVAHRCRSLASGMKVDVYKRQEVGRAGMAIDARFDSARGVVYLTPGKQISVGMMLTRDEFSKVRVIAQSPDTDAVMAQSDDITVKLGM